MKLSSAILALTALFPLACAGEAPHMKDYARGVVIERYTQMPLVELSLPDEVYQGVTRPDLRDLRIFNAQGAAVPHAFCSAHESSEVEIIERSAPVFELSAGRRSTEDGARIEVRTNEGTQINVQDARVKSTASSGRMHIIDMREIYDPVRAIVFDWSSPDEASQAKVRVEASEDLDHWEVIVASSTLLRVRQAEQELRSERISLPERTYAYLRVQRVDGGPPLTVRSVSVESAPIVPELEPTWFTPHLLAAAEPGEILYDAARFAPVSFARLRAPQENSSMSLILQSRADTDAQWKERWRGESYLVVTNTERRESPPARFAAVTDRYWRVVTADDAQAPRPMIELGYRPLRVRFLAQGADPFTLAFGSRRAGLATPADCEGLLGDVSAIERRQMIGEAYASDFKTLGGGAALKPPPRQTPLRLIVLWTVLIVGVGLLIAMAVALMKRARPDDG